MNRAAASPLLAPLAEFIARHLGLHFPPERAADLQRGLQAAAREFDFDDAEACATWLLSAPLNGHQIEVLASHLTVGETYFFRERSAFTVLEEHVLPELIQSRRESGRRLRIWSAACCSGEEAYSLALSVRRALPLPERANWDVSIIGTDLNPRFLQRAARGVFGEWSFRGAPPGFKEIHFRKVGDGEWEIRPEIREMVQFFPLNLAEEIPASLSSLLGGVDLIFCRNVLIYFAAERAAQVVGNLTDCLADDGWLVLGPSEIALTPPPGLSPRPFAGTTLYRKEPGGRSAAAALPEVWAGMPWAMTEAEAEMDREREAEVEMPFAAEADEEQAMAYQEQPYEPASLTPAAAVDDGLAPSARLLLARAQANQGNLTEALASCDRALAADKLNPAGHYLRASVLQELGELDEAVPAFQRALYLEPGFVLAHFALGNLARRRGRLAAADRHFAHALAGARAQPADELLPEAEGLTAGRMAEIIAALRPAGAGV